MMEQAIAASQSPTRKTTATSTRTCPVCAAQAKALFAFFAQWQYTLATDAPAQCAFAAERGLCPVHTWQFQEMASPQGLSEGYAPLIEMLASELSRLAEHTGELPSASLAALLASTATCVACRLVRETAAEQIEHLLASLAMTKDGRDDASSMELCLPHLQATLDHLEKRADGTIERRVVAGFLLREQARRLEQLAEDLRSYALKRDALRRGLLHQEEASAWRQALVQLVGERAARGGAMMADSGTV